MRCLIGQHPVWRVWPEWIHTVVIYTEQIIASQFCTMILTMVNYLRVIQFNLFCNCWLDRKMNIALEHKHDVDSLNL